jgi:hypothetical protein
MTISGPLNGKPGRYGLLLMRQLNRQQFCIASIKLMGRYKSSYLAGKHENMGI